MNIWVIVVLLGVLAMVFGPVMLLQPSDRERCLDELRGRARALGLEVSMRALPRQPTDTGEPDRQPAYRLPAARGGGPVPPWQLVRAPYAHETHFLDTWAWQGEGRPSRAERAVLAQWLPALPKSAGAVEGNATGWSVYWRELGGVKGLERLYELLCALRDCNRPRASGQD